MMQLVFSVGLPWWFGYLIIQIISGRKENEIVLIAIGYGYFIGCLLVIGLCILYSLSWKFSILLASVILATINIMLFLYIKKRTLSTDKIIRRIHGYKLLCNNTTVRIICTIGLAIIVTRLVSLGAEIILQPLYPWDAYTSWLPKARLWFLSNELLPVIDGWKWMSGHNMPEDIYVHVSARERNYLSYITLWHSMAIGYWDESLSLLPWLLAIAAFICAIAGQLLEADLPIPVIILVILLYLSMPILNSHVALPGYADLWVSIFVTLAIASLYHRSSQIGHLQSLLAGVMILSCLLVKSQSGTVWACLLFLVAVVSYLDITMRKIYLIVISSAIACLSLILIEVDIGDPKGINLIFNADLIKIPYLFNSATPSVDEIMKRLIIIIKNLFFYSNWGLFWYLFIFSIISVIKSASIITPPSIIFFVLSSISIVLTYVFMVNYTNVSIDTVINRGFLHVVPAYLFIISIHTYKIQQINSTT